MSVTYPHDRPLSPADRHDGLREEPFVPVYARTGRTARGRRKSGMKTWMILAPIGVLVLGGAAAALMMGDGGDVAPAPLVEPAATPPVLPAQPLVTETVTAGTDVAPVVEATPAPAPAVRAAPAPARRSTPAPARRVAPAPAPAETTREAPAEPAGPQPYTARLNATPATPASPAAPAPTPAPPPVIVIQPGT